MSRSTVLVDVAIAVLIAALVLLLSPGFAITAILALLIVVICGVSLLWSAARSRRRRRRTAGDWR